MRAQRFALAAGENNITTHPLNESKASLEPSTRLPKSANTVV
jgi:hypothetical protein